MAQRFRQQVVVVTGASSGIGRATAEAFAREGARLVVGARRRDRIEEVAARLRRGGREARAVPCNVTVPAQLRRLVDAAVSRWERLDVVVCNAGIGLTGDLAEAHRDDVRHVLDVNVLGVVNTLHAALPHMLDAGRGHVVIVSSVLGYRGIPRFAGYCASKAALVSLSEGLRTELAPRGIGVTLICPGLTESEFFEKRLGRPGPEPLRERFRPTPAATVARRIVGGVARRKKRVVVSPGGRALVFFSRHAPWLVDRLAAAWHARTGARERVKAGDER